MRIAQVTDLHLRQYQPGTAALGRRRSRLMGQLLDRVLNQLQDQSIDLLAVTGDLLDVPNWLIQPTPGFEGDDPAYWSRAVEADYRMVKQKLDASGLPYMVLPGNHDLDSIMWRVFDPQDHVRELDGRRVVRFCDREHEGHFPRRFNPERKRWEQELATDNGQQQIHLQHYVITPQLNQGYPHTYADAASLLEKNVESGKVQLSLSGHYHKGTQLIQHGASSFATGPAFCVPPFRWRVYEITNQSVEMTEHQLAADAQPTRPVVFLDRDGVINDLPSYQTGPEEMRLLPGSASAIHRLGRAGYAVVVITSQSCVGLGYVPEQVLHSVNDKMARLLAEEGEAELDAIYASTSAGDKAVFPKYRQTDQAKPNPTLLFKARDELNLTLANGWMVGDAITDAHAAHAAGVRPVMVRTGRGAEHESCFKQAYPDQPVLDDLAAAADFILKS